MSEDQRQDGDPQDDENDEMDELDGEGGEDQPASTPFDNPFLLPVLLWAFAAYFGYDIVTDAEAYQKYPLFNQVGFAVLTLLAIYYTWSAIKERREGSSD